MDMNEVIFERLTKLADEFKGRTGGGYYYDEEEAARENGKEDAYENAADDLRYEVSELRRLATVTDYELCLKARTFRMLDEAGVDRFDTARWKEMCDVTAFLRDFGMVEFDAETGKNKLTERGWAVI